MNIDVEALAKAIDSEFSHDNCVPACLSYVGGAETAAHMIAAEYARLVPAEDEGRLRIADDFSGVDREHSKHTDGPDCWCRPFAYYVHTTSAALAATPEPR
jgi:hypothetical protein